MVVLKECHTGGTADGDLRAGSCKIADRQAGNVAESGQGETRLGGEGTVAVTLKKGNAAVSPAHDNVRVGATAEEVAHGHGIRVVDSGGVDFGSAKRAAAVAQEDQQL